MKKVIVLFCLFVLSINIFAQVNVKEYVNFNHMQDSLFTICLQKIYNDLALGEDSIPKRSYFGVHSFIGEVYFIKKCSYTLFLFGATDKMEKKRSKQGTSFSICKQIYFPFFRRYIEDNNELPYDLIEYFRYQFITSYDDSPEAQAIYGEYKFSVTKEEGFNIIEKKIEVLQGRDAIMRKHKTNF